MGGGARVGPGRVETQRVSRSPSQDSQETPGEGEERGGEPRGGGLSKASHGPSSSSLLPPNATPATLLSLTSEPSLSPPVAQRSVMCDARLRCGTDGQQPQHLSLSSAGPTSYALHARLLLPPPHSRSSLPLSPTSRHRSLLFPQSAVDAAVHPLLGCRCSALIRPRSAASVGR